LTATSQRPGKFRERAESHLRLIFSKGEQTLMVAFLDSGFQVDAAVAVDFNGSYEVNGEAIVRNL